MFKEEEKKKKEERNLQNLIGEKRNQEIRVLIIY